MTEPCLLLDMNNLCHISFHTMGHLSTDDKRTGVFFGVLKQMLMFAKKFESKRFFFFWDSRRSYRKEIYPEYKGNRQNNKNEADKKILYDQITELRRDVIPQMGFKNYYIQSGFEADDLISKFVIDYNEGREMIIISTDQDLFQTLRPNVRIFNPIKKSFYTEDDFRENFGMHPINYRIIKSIAGCSSDNIQGIPGIGEKTAAKYLRAEINNSKQFNDIKANQALRDLNEKLVFLPLIHGPVQISKMKVVKNELSYQKFKNIFNRYSFDSFLKDFQTWEKNFGLV